MVLEAMTGGHENRARAVVAIGVFDGLHLGHRVLLQAARTAAAAEGCLAGVVTFDPPPYAFFTGNPAPLEITPLAEKSALMTGLGIDRVLALPFGAGIAALTPAAFVDDVLRREFDLAGVVVGHDFRFGAGRAGDGATLQALGAERGFTVTIIPPVELEGHRISSTSLRQHINAGRVAAAARLMGRPLIVAGVVGRGRGLGSRLRVPTANLEVSPRQLLPAAGVYVAAATVARGTFPGAANVGPAPTVGSGHERLVEVHLLDFEGDLRGTELRVGFLDRLRDEQVFPDLDALRAAMAADIQAVRAWWRSGAENPVAGRDPM